MPYTEKRERTAKYTWQRRKIFTATNPSIPEGSFAIQLTSDARTEEQIQSVQDIVDSCQQLINTALKDSGLLGALRMFAVIPGFTKENLSRHIRANIRLAEKNEDMVRSVALDHIKDLLVEQVWKEERTRHGLPL